MAKSPTSIDQRTILQRWLPHPVLSLALVVLWLLLINSFSAGGLLVGIVLGIIIPRLTGNFWPDRPEIRNYRKAFAYLALVTWDVIVANMQVAFIIAFRPVSSLNTRWVRMPIELTHPEALTLLAGTITMTPGTVSCDFSADGKYLLVHCLDAPDAEAIVQEMKTRYEARLKEIF